MIQILVKSGLKFPIQHITVFTKFNSSDMLNGICVPYTFVSKASSFVLYSKTQNEIISLRASCVAIIKKMFIFQEPSFSYYSGCSLSELLQISPNQRPMVPSVTQMLLHQTVRCTILTGQPSICLIRVTAPSSTSVIGGCHT